MLWLDGFTHLLYHELFIVITAKTFQVNGLTVASREGYLTLVKDALNNNLAAMKDIDSPDPQLSKRDVEQCAIQMEYEEFCKSTVVSLYRRAMIKLVKNFYLPVVSYSLSFNR